MTPDDLQRILEAALLAHGKPLTLDKLQSLFMMEDTLDLESNYIPSKDELQQALAAIADSCEGRGFELKQVSSGWRFQVREDLAPWINRLWEEKPQRYTRALLETLAIIAYRQPITRSDIEEIRGVAVSTSIIKTLAEREWVKVVGQRDVPGRPSLYATTRQFLDYFNMQSLDELPSLQELTDIESLNPELDLADKPPLEDKDLVVEKAAEEPVEERLEEQVEEPVKEPVPERVETVDDSAAIESTDVSLSP